MNVRDVLDFPSLAGASVVTGEAGLDNAVTSVMVMEAVDIDQWGKRGQLILTSFFAMRGLDSQELCELFETMARIGIAGVVFKAERLVSELPEGLVDTCGRCGLPIVRVPKQAHYEAIMFDVFGRIVDSQVTLLTHYYDMHQRALELAMQCPSYLQIVQFLKRHVRSEVTYLDTLTDERVSTDSQAGEFESFALEPLERDRYQSYDYFEATLRYEGGRSVRALAVRVPTTHSGERYLFCHGGTWQLKPLDVMVLENVVSTLQLEDLRRDTESQQLFFELNSIVHDILNGRLLQGDGVFEQRLDQLGLSSFPYYQCLLVRVELTGEANTYEFRDLANSIVQKVKSAYLNVAYYQSNNRITFLRNCSTPQEGFDAKAVTRLLDSLHDVKALPDFTFTAMQSRLGSVADIGALNADVINMLKLFGASRGYDCFFDYDRLGTFKLFLQVSGDSELTDFVDARMERLYLDNPELFRCAVLLCENGLNYSETARQLFLHPKTVHYRMGRLRQVYDIDLKNSDDRLQLLIADKINVLSGGLGAEEAGA